MSDRPRPGDILRIRGDWTMWRVVEVDGDDVRRLASGGRPLTLAVRPAFESGLHALPPAVSLDALKQSFANVYATMDAAVADADMAIALYNPRSRSRPDTLGAARDLLVEAVGPDRVVVVARHVGRDEESSWVTTLGELDVEAVDMGCLVVIGASTTRVTDDGRVWTPRSVG